MVWVWRGQRPGVLRRAAKQPARASPGPQPAAPQPRHASRPHLHFGVGQRAGRARNLQHKLELLAAVGRARAVLRLRWGGGGSGGGDGGGHRRSCCLGPPACGLGGGGASLLARRLVCRSGSLLAGRLVSGARLVSCVARLAGGWVARRLLGLALLPVGCCLLVPLGGSAGGRLLGLLIACCSRLLLGLLAQRRRRQQQHRERQEQRQAQTAARHGSRLTRQRGCLEVWREAGWAGAAEMCRRQAACKAAARGRRGMGGGGRICLPALPSTCPMPQGI